jgi:hypothetical protein
VTWLNGYSDGEINEIVANGGLNIFTNYFNHVNRDRLPCRPESVTDSTSFVV